MKIRGCTYEKWPKIGFLQTFFRIFISDDYNITTKMNLIKWVSKEFNKKLLDMGYPIKLP